MLVRLGPAEVDPGQPDRPEKRFVDKEPQTGLCVHLDRETELCGAWDRAPTICREFDCNGDHRLQSVLCYGFVSITNFRPVPPGFVSIRVPHREDG